MDEEPDREVVQLRVMERLQEYAAAQSERGRDFARHMGLHTSDATAVVEIVRAEQKGRPITPARLARRIGLTTGATSILLNRLEDAGNITRARGHADRRVVTLHASTSMQRQAATLFAPTQELMMEVLRSHSLDELELVDHILAELTALGAHEPG